jgi:hypothetical protein
MKNKEKTFSGTSDKYLHLLTIWFRVRSPQMCEEYLVFAIIYGKYLNLKMKKKIRSSGGFE